MRLLFAEDDVLLGRATCLALLQAGHAVDWVTDGQQMLTVLGRHQYDCVLLDLGLPELTGDACLRALRGREHRVPVIVLSARALKDDRIAVLDLGADDYMVKPYDLEEMAARVRAVVRRSREGGVKAERVHGPLRLRSATRTALWHGAAVALTAKEYLLLDALLRVPDRIVTREQLEQSLYTWGEDLGSNAIEVHVHHLRRKLSRDLIVTVRGVGYRLGLEQAAPDAPGAD